MRKEKFDKNKAGRIHSIFSKTLMYNQNSAHIISVKNFPESSLIASEHAILDLTMNDFYDERNNAAFSSYCRGLNVSEDEKLCYSSKLMKENVEKPFIIKRENCGKLMEVLFCLKFGGVPLNSESDTDDKYIPVLRLLAVFQVLLDKTGTDKEWTFLNDEINKFADMCEKNDYDIDVAIDYIANELCVRKS